MLDKLQYTPSTFITLSIFQTSVEKRSTWNQYFIRYNYYPTFQVSQWFLSGTSWKWEP